MADEDNDRPGNEDEVAIREFRRDAASIVLDQKRTIADVARERGGVERGEREGLTSEERTELAPLRREVKRLTSSATCSNEAWPSG